MYSGSTTTIHSFVSISMCSFLADSLKEREREKRERERERERERWERKVGARVRRIWSICCLPLLDARRLCVCDHVQFSQTVPFCCCFLLDRRCLVLSFSSTSIRQQGQFLIRSEIDFTQSVSQKRMNDDSRTRSDLQTLRPRDRRLTCCAFLFNPADSQIATRRSCWSTLAAILSDSKRSEEDECAGNFFHISAATSTCRACRWSVVVADRDGHGQFLKIDLQIMRPVLESSDQWITDHCLEVGYSYSRAAALLVGWWRIQLWLLFNPFQQASFKS